MQHITFDELQKDLRSVFTQVFDDHEPLAVSFDKNKAVVVVEMDDYVSLMNYDRTPLLLHPDTQ